MNYTRLVIDSNSLSSEELASFLAETPTNVAVLTDYAWMEAYKANSSAILKKSMAVLRDYPDQVANLWGTKKIGAMNFRGAALGDMMIRTDVKKNFVQMLRSVERLPDDSAIPLKFLTSHVHAARDHIEGRLLADVETTRSAFPDMQSLFSQPEIDQIRAGNPHSRSVVEKVFWLASKTSASVGRRHPLKAVGPTPKSQFNNFLFRYALGYAVYFLEWIKRGSPRNEKSEKVRNDLIDLNFAIYGTYFNGIMSKDKKLIEFHRQMRAILGLLRARMPEDHSITYPSFSSTSAARSASGRAP